MRAWFEIVHAEDALVVVAKACGLATIRERDPHRPCLQQLLEEEFGRRVWVVHRIDKDTSGLVLFALDSRAHRDLCGAFERRDARKTYRAVVDGDPGDQGEIEVPLRVYGSGRSGVDFERGKPSSTRWRRLRHLGPWTELEVEPVTGRRHQIRAHLWSIGHPVIGDPLYGESARRAEPGRMLLHAARLRLEYPSRHLRDWSAPVPADYSARLDHPPARA